MIPMRDQCQVRSGKSGSVTDSGRRRWPPIRSNGLPVDRLSLTILRTTIGQAPTAFTVAATGPSTAESSRGSYLEKES